MKIEIRNANKKDVSGISELVLKEFNKKPYRDKWTSRTAGAAVQNFLKIGWGFVAIENKKIVGAIIVRDEPYGKGLLIPIEQFVVDADFQKRGIGSLLLKKVEEKAKKKKANAIYLSVWEKAQAFKFYLGRGYKESKEIKIIGKKIR